MTFDPENNPEDARAVRDVFAELVTGIDRAVEREAKGWIVVSTDLEFNSLNAGYGIFEQPEQALAWAARADADRFAGLTDEDGGPGWSHTVLPLFDHGEHIHIDKV